MQRFGKALPPLGLLVAFEAAARSSSFTLAAEELNVTQSAVSQRIRNLEEHLGVALFERGHRYVHLTAAGREFYNSVSLALTHLVGSADRVRENDNAPTLNIATDQSVATLWLLPRLSQFQEMHPEICIRLVASDNEERCFQESVQVAVVHGEGSWPGYDCVAFFEEEIFPVCSEAYLNSLPEEMTLAGLSKVLLIDLEYEHWNWMNWGIWLTEMGLHHPARQEVLRSNSYPLLIDAARRGQGVALGWRHLVDDDLLSGALVCPVKKSVRTRHAYHLVRRHNAAAPPEAEAFFDWLIAQRDDQRLFPI
jgi:DNA-binding transcriptional LysR family regulator